LTFSTIWRGALGLLDKITIEESEHDHLNNPPRIVNRNRRRFALRLLHIPQFFASWDVFPLLVKCLAVTFLARHLEHIDIHVLYLNTTSLGCFRELLIMAGTSMKVFFLKIPAVSHPEALPETLPRVLDFHANSHLEILNLSICHFGIQAMLATLDIIPSTNMLSHMEIAIQNDGQDSLDSLEQWSRLNDVLGSSRRFPRLQTVIIPFFIREVPSSAVSHSTVEDYEEYRAKELFVYSQAKMKMVEEAQKPGLSATSKPCLQFKL